MVFFLLADYLSGDQYLLNQQLHTQSEACVFFVDRSSSPYIGDVMKKFAPFLKLYVDYVRNFDHAMDAINTWTEKSPAFASLLAALQVLANNCF